MSVPRSVTLDVLVVEDEDELGSLLRDDVTTLGHRADVVGSAEPRWSACRWRRTEQSRKAQSRTISPRWDRLSPCDPDRVMSAVSVSVKPASPTT